MVSRVLFHISMLLDQIRGIIKVHSFEFRSHTSNSVIILKKLSLMHFDFFLNNYKSLVNHYKKVVHTSSCLLLLDY